MDFAQSIYVHKKGINSYFTGNFFCYRSKHSFNMLFYSISIPIPYFLYAIQLCNQRWYTYYGYHSRYIETRGRPLGSDLENRIQNLIGLFLKLCRLG